MVACTATLNSLAAAYAGYGRWIGVCTGNPGTGTTPAHEAAGGSPAYARIETTWSAETTGVQNGTSVVVALPPGVYTYMLIASAVSGNTMTDNISFPAVTQIAQGNMVFEPSYTQT
jgi:hypothetical protein